MGSHDYCIIFFSYRVAFIFCFWQFIKLPKSVNLGIRNVPSVVMDLSQKDKHQGFQSHIVIEPHTPAQPKYEWSLLYRYNPPAQFCCRSTPCRPADLRGAWMTVCISQTRRAVYNAEEAAFSAEDIRGGVKQSLPDSKNMLWWLYST